MPEQEQTSGSMDVVTRLLAATNSHDLARLVACFAADYVNDTPAHPGRGFTGREQVRANWHQLFASIPDLRATIVSVSVDGDVVWSEWRMNGTRPDGAPHELVGVIVFTIRGNEIAHARFFLEPVEHESGTVDDNIRRATKQATP